MSRRKVLATLLAAGLLLTAVPAAAGIVLTRSDGTTEYYADGVTAVRDPRGSLVIAWDHNAGKVVLADAAGGRYAVTTAAEIALVTRRMMAIVERREKKGDTGKGSKAAKAPKVTTVKTGSGGRIAGHETELWEVRVDGRLVESLWIAPKVSLTKEGFDLRTIGETSRGIAARLGMAELAAGYENSPAYFALWERGYPLRVVTIAPDGASSTAEVTSVSFTTIPQSIFFPAKGERRVTLEEFWGGR